MFNYVLEITNNEHLYAPLFYANRLIGTRQKKDKATE